METIILILQLVIPNTYCTKIDFDGCYTIIIAAEYQKYQHFLIRIMFQLTCLSNGYRPGPRKFMNFL